jgi:hypothetical protein
LTPNRLNPTPSHNKTQINNILISTSGTLIKIIITDLKEEEKDLFNQHLNTITDLLNITPNETHKQTLLDQFTVMETNFRAT